MDITKLPEITDEQIRLFESRTARRKFNVRGTTYASVNKNNFIINVGYTDSDGWQFNGNNSQTQISLNPQQITLKSNGVNSIVIQNSNSQPLIKLPSNIEIGVSNDIQYNLNTGKLTCQKSVEITGGLKVGSTGSNITNIAQSIIGELTINNTTYYTKNQVETAYYNKTYVDTTYYTKTQVDALLVNVYSSITSLSNSLGNYYTKTQVDGKIPPSPTPSP